MFTKQTYISRRDILKKSVGTGILLFFGNEESPINYRDNQYSFRQDSTFLYYFGFEKNASLAAVIDIDNNIEIVFGDELTIDDIVWTGKLPTLKEQAFNVGISRVQSLCDLSGYLKKEGALNRKIHFLPQYRNENVIKIWEMLGIPAAEQESAKSLNFVRAVVNMRNYKSEEEIEEIDKAAKISMEMHLTAIRTAKAGMKECEVMAEIHAAAHRAGAELSFPIICTVHGETLHNHHYTNELKEGGMLLVDAGAELPSGYCGDISSTIPVGKHFDTRQRAIYEIVYKSHRAAVEALKPGVPFKEVYYLACKTIFEGLKTLGLTRGDSDEAVHAGANALFFQCGLGHMMGLDVHDMENLGEVWVGYDGEPKSTQFGIKSLRLARRLEPGFVLTIEPGIYFIPSLIEMWSAEKRFNEYINYPEVEKWRNLGGIRNEEDYLITETGHKLLGNPVSKEILNVEKMRQ